jgi:tetratricopeptide (TPR) repeat protein
MKYLFLVLLLSAYSFSYSQTNFTKGFLAGYKNGSCFDQSPCIPPDMPVPPVPGTYEAADSYQDGYKRGFQMGLDDSKVSAARYRLASVEPIDYAAKLNTNDTAQRAALIRQLKARTLELIKIGGYKPAIALCDVAIKANPYSDEFYRIAASAYLQLRNYDGALIYLKKAERIPSVSTTTLDMIRSIKDGSIQKQLQ